MVARTDKTKAAMKVGQMESMMADEKVGKWDLTMVASKVDSMVVN